MDTYPLAVAVPALGVRDPVDEGVGREKPRDLRAVDPAVHVDDAGAVELFVIGVAAAGELAQRRDIGRRRSAFPTATPASNS